MIQNVTITRIYKGTEPTQYGSFKIGLKLKEYGDKWINGFAKDFNYNEGDQVELDIITSDRLDKEGNPYINWKFPKKEDQSNLKISQIEFSLSHLRHNINEIVAEIKKHHPDTKLKGMTSAETPVPTFVPNTPEQSKDFEQKMDAYEAKQSEGEDDINPEDIPF